jgi:hypothetical protein
VEKQAKGLKNRGEADAVLATVQEAREVVTGMGPGGDL